MALSKPREDIVSELEKFKEHHDRQVREDLRLRARAGVEPVLRHEYSIRNEAKKVFVNDKSQLVNQNIRICCGQVRSCEEHHTDVLEATGIISKEILLAPGVWTLGGVSSQLFKLIYKQSETDILTVTELRAHLTATDGDESAWEKLLCNEAGRFLLTISLHYGLKIVRVETLPTLATAGAPQPYKDFYNSSTGVTAVFAYNGLDTYDGLKPVKDGKPLGNHPLTLVNYETGEEAAYKASAAAYVIKQHQYKVNVVDGRGVNLNAVSLQPILPPATSSTASNDVEDKGQLSTKEKDYVAICAGAAYDKHPQPEVPQPDAPQPAAPVSLQRSNSAASADSFTTFASEDLGILPLIESDLEKTYITGSFTEEVDALAGAQGAQSPLSEKGSPTQVGFDTAETDFYSVGKAFLEEQGVLAVPAAEKYAPLFGASAAGHQFFPAAAASSTVSEDVHARDPVGTKCVVTSTRRKPDNGDTLTTFTAPLGNRFVVRSKSDSVTDWTPTTSQALLGKDFVVTKGKIEQCFKGFFDNLGNIVCVDSVSKPKRDETVSNFKGYAEQVGILKTRPRSDKDRNRVKHCINHLVSDVYAAVEAGLQPYFEKHRKLSYQGLQRDDGVPRFTAEDDNYLGDAPPAKRAKGKKSSVSDDSASD